MYDAFGRLLYDVMSTFIKPKLLLDADDSRKEAKLLGKMDVQLSSNQKSFHEVNVGTAARQIIAKLEQKSKNMDLSKLQMKSCLIEVASYLQSHLPHDSTFLHDARALHPDFRKPSFGRLAYIMANVLSNTGIYTKPSANFADDIRRQYSLL